MQQSVESSRGGLVRRAGIRLPVQRARPVRMGRGDGHLLRLAGGLSHLHPEGRCRRVGDKEPVDDEGLRELHHPLRREAAAEREQRPRHPLQAERLVLARGHRDPAPGRPRQQLHEPGRLAQARGRALHRVDLRRRGAEVQAGRRQLPEQAGRVERGRGDGERPEDQGRPQRHDDRRRRRLRVFDLRRQSARRHPPSGPPQREGPSALVRPRPQHLLAQHPHQGAAGDRAAEAAADGCRLILRLERRGRDEVPAGGARLGRTACRRRQAGGRVAREHDPRALERRGRLPGRRGRPREAGDDGQDDGLPLPIP